MEYLQSGTRGWISNFTAPRNEHFYDVIHQLAPSTIRLRPVIFSSLSGVKPHDHRMTNKTAVARNFFAEGLFYSVAPLCTTE
jgi:hypothetical protein